MTTHAKLAPSSASRWIACTPSAHLEAQFPDKAGAAAAEGTLAHKLGEAKIRLAAKQISKAQYSKIVKEVEADALFTPDMHDYAEDYATFVLERFAEAKAHTPDAKLFVETRLDMTDYVPEGFGTGDVCIVADTVADFIDLKYGKGVEVSAVNNKQMMLYALGLLKEFSFMYNIETVRMTIYQPRIDNVSTWEIYTTELLHWAETELKPKAALAFNGEGDFTPGSHCQFCRVRATCRAHAEQQLEVLQYDFKAAALLNDDEVVDVLKRASALTSWLKEIGDHALDQAVNNGKKWPGMKLVEGRSNRMYKDAEAVSAKLLQAGFAEEIIYEPRTILGITAMEKAIGKKPFAEFLDGLVIKPAGKPTLVSADDKRPELNGVDKIQADFAEPIEA